ncbi:sigma-w pathway protein ysdB [Salipaludibacillus keqinensis]|uniref:Sigma-w pathway protein ysdB n=1 Tax=Salipaludibacillus keqinensis TaxID=2045207 RepID=A0A323TGV9_9BACI|nr:sigma-w pathway protein ysdB [Salipaludibacillus keqinensis]PYZ93710.1 sigma-w pathway protein ysdB [Salipaludibacillus keqinensis]
MFTVILFRVFLLIAVGIIVFSLAKYLIDPRRKLETAHRQGNFYLLDDPDNVRKNILFTFRSTMFEGEKFLGAANDSFEVTSIMVWTEDGDQLQGLSRRDFQFIEKELLLRYPKAEVEWRSPIRELLKRLERRGK